MSADKTTTHESENERLLSSTYLATSCCLNYDFSGWFQFVCMGGTPHRMEKFAYYILRELGLKICPGTMLQDLSAKSHRYAMFKVGPVMSVSVSRIEKFHNG